MGQNENLRNNFSPIPFSKNMLVTLADYIHCGYSDAFIAYCNTACRKKRSVIAQFFNQAYRNSYKGC